MGSLRNLVRAAILLSGLSVPSTGAAQQDSLLRVADNKAFVDTVRLDALQQLATSYMRSVPDSCLYYAGRYAELATALKNEEHRANAAHLKGISYFLTGRLDEALTALEKSAAIRNDLHDPLAKAATLNVIGAVYMQKGDLARAMDNYVQCLELSEKAGDRRGIAGSHHNIGRIYAQQNDLEKALEHFQTSLVNREPDDLLGRASEIDLMASTFADLGKDTMALKLFHEALELRVKADDASSIGMSYSNLGKFHLQSGAIDSAIAYSNKSVVQFEKGKDRMGISLAYLNIADAHQVRGQHREAIQWAQRSMAIAEELHDVRATAEAAKVLSDSYAALGRTDKAFMFYRRYIGLRDSMQSEENQREVLRQEYTYTYGKQALADSLGYAADLELKAEEVQRQKVVRNGFIGGFVLVALFAVIFLFQRNRIGREKARSEELLHNILPEEVAAELRVKGEAEAVHIDLATVLFTDFKGFTAMSEVLTPRDLVKDLHECFSAFDNICEKHGIEKIKTIGDAYMAAGGLPVPNTTHAQDVIKAAFEMRDFVEEGKARKIAAGLPYFEIRIGIHTGPVVAGIVGVKKFQYDIWGDTVNTASRMESSGEVGQVNISEATYALVMNAALIGEAVATNDRVPSTLRVDHPDDGANKEHRPAFTFTPRGKVQAKGKGEMEMYFVERMERTR